MTRQQFNFHDVDAIDSVNLILKKKTNWLFKSPWSKTSDSGHKKEPKQRQTLKICLCRTGTHAHMHTYPSCLLHHQVSDLLIEMQLTFASIEGDVGPEGTDIILELDTNNPNSLSTHITNTQQQLTLTTAHNLHLSVQWNRNAAVIWANVTHRAHSHCRRVRATHRENSATATLSGLSEKTAKAFFLWTNSSPNLFCLWWLTTD